MAAKFEIDEENGKYRFRLKTANGRVIATSGEYPTRRRALHGIESLRKAAATATISEEGVSSSPALATYH